MSNDKGIDPGSLPGIPSAQFDSQNYRPSMGGPAQQRIGGSGTTGLASPDLVYWGDQEEPYYVRGTSKRIRKVPYLIPLNDSRYMLDTLAPAYQKMLDDTLDKYYGKGVWDKSWRPKLWERAINISSNSYKYAGPGNAITPIDAFKLIAEQDSAGMKAAGGGAGGGGGGTTVSKTVQLTNPTNARSLVDDALTKYLGRRATPNESQKFYQALNAQERQNPYVTTTTRSGNASESLTEGGFNPSTFAEDYARGQEGSSEFQAATTLLDAFIGSLKARV